MCTLLSSPVTSSAHGRLEEGRFPRQRVSRAASTQRGQSCPRRSRQEIPGHVWVPQRGLPASRAATALSRSTSPSSHEGMPSGGQPSPRRRSLPGRPQWRMQLHPSLREPVSMYARACVSVCMSPSLTAALGGWHVVRWPGERERGRRRGRERGGREEASQGAHGRERTGCMDSVNGEGKQGERELPGLGPLP